MNKKKILIFLVGGAVIILFFWVFIASFRSKSENEYKPEKFNTALNKHYFSEIIFPVTTSIVKKGILTSWINTNGYSYASLSYEVKPKLSGQIIEMDAFNGKIVRNGDILFKIENAEYRLALEGAKNQLISSQIDYNFQKSGPIAKINEDEYKNVLDSLQIVYEKANKDLISKKISDEEYKRIKRDYETIFTITSINREDVIAMRSGLSSAIVNYNKASLDFDNTILKAPIKGIISDCSVHQGSCVQGGQMCMKVIDVSSILIQCQVTENDLVRINVGNLAQVLFIALPNEIFRGKVIEINPSIDIQNRTSLVTILVENSKSLIKPGMFASIKIGTGLLQNIIIVPQSAVLVRDNRALVFTFVKGLAAWRYVTLGKQNDQYQEITSGISVGDTLIVDGNYNLAHQSKVKIENWKKY